MQKLLFSLIGAITILTGCSNHHDAMALEEKATADALNHPLYEETLQPSLTQIGK